MCSAWVCEKKNKIKFFRKMVNNKFLLSFFVFLFLCLKYNFILMESILFTRTRINLILVRYTFYQFYFFFSGDADIIYESSDSIHRNTYKKYSKESSSARIQSKKLIDMWMFIDSIINLIASWPKYWKIICWKHYFFFVEDEASKFYIENYICSVIQAHKQFSRQRMIRFETFVCESIYQKRI